jgi:excisionase family DNA binding protein
MTATALTIEQAAERLNMHPNTVYRLCKSGALPGVFRFGRVWRIDADTLHEHIRSPWARDAGSQR